MITMLDSCFQMKKPGVTVEDLPVNKLHDWVIFNLLMCVKPLSRTYSTVHGILHPIFVMFVLQATGPSSTVQIS